MGFGLRYDFSATKLMLSQRGCRLALKALGFSHHNVPRIKGRVTADLISKYLALDEPVIISGSLSHWPIYKKLSGLRREEAKLSYLEKVLGDHKLQFSLHPKFGRLPLSRRSTEFYEGRFSDFRGMASSHKEKVCYLESSDFNNYPEFGTPPIQLKSFGQSTRLWMGFGGQITNLHFDSFYNCISMIAGRKRITLFPHDVLPYMYPAPIGINLNGAPASCVRLLEKNKASFPLFKKALKQVQVAVLNPGETLFIPPLWWHHVESFDFNFMINQWNLPFSNDKRSRMVRNFFEGIILFDKLKPEQRLPFAGCYENLVFRVSNESSEFNGGGAFKFDPSFFKRFQRHFAEAVAIYHDAPYAYRAGMATDYNYFVFQKFGRPLPHLSSGMSKAMKLKISKLLRSRRPLYGGWG